MTEIKTLKDIEPKFKKGLDLVATDTLKEQLRQEAIKWIKQYEEMELPEAIPEEVREYGKGMTIDFIRHVFNITEEDEN